MSDVEKWGEEVVGHPIVEWRGVIAACESRTGRRGTKEVVWRTVLPVDEVGCEVIVRRTGAGQGASGMEAGLGSDMISFDEELRRKVM